jgi:hypothetical protein
MNQQARCNKVAVALAVNVEGSRLYVLVEEHVWSK